MWKNIRPWNLLLFFTAIIIGLGILATVYAYIHADRLVKHSLLERANIIASTLEETKVGALSGTENDLYAPHYRDLKSKLMTIVAIDPEIRFAYLTGRRDGEIFFLVDSEPEDSPDLSPPGQVYDEATAVFHGVFDTGESALEGPVVDRWGTWISAMSPMLDPVTGEIIAVVGLDVSARNYYRTLTLYTTVPILLTLLLASFAFFIFRLVKKEDALLAFKSELASIAAHDLRTPLVGINWSIESLLQKTRDANTPRTLATIRDTSAKLLGTIDDILETFTLEKGERTVVWEPYDLATVLADAASVFTLAARQKQVTIVFASDMPASIPARGDRAKIQRMFSNLIANAVKYSPERGVVDVRCEETPHAHIVIVENSGPEVPNAERSQLFRKYYRNQKAAQTARGMGLGLYYVKRIAELHGGDVRYAFTGGKNIFSVELPKQQ
ncbi:HAMP domain-containing histidine kinase [Candidatus Kaiserbacteria bacterium]|nr:HAMP domain-containing histidine kinase [Candidatus Kaiserbacteria bacterium]